MTIPQQARRFAALASDLRVNLYAWHAKHLYIPTATPLRMWPPDAARPGRPQLARFNRLRVRITDNLLEHDNDT